MNEFVLSKISLVAKKTKKTAITPTSNSENCNALNIGSSAKKTNQGSNIVWKKGGIVMGLNSSRTST